MPKGQLKIRVSDLTQFSKICDSQAGNIDLENPFFEPVSDLLVKVYKVTN